MQSVVGRDLSLGRSSRSSLLSRSVFLFGPCFSWDQDQTDPQRCGRRTEYFTPLKRIPQLGVHLSRKRMAQEERERRESATIASLPLSPRAMLTYSLYPTIRGRVAPLRLRHPRSLAPRSLAFILASDDDDGRAKPHSHSRREE